MFQHPDPLPRWLCLISLPICAFGSGCNLIENWGDYEYLSGANGWSGATSYDDSDADVFFDIATTSMTVSAEPAENRDAMEGFVREIAAERPDVDVILFGETITGLYRSSADDEENTAYQQSVAEPIPGPTTDRMSALAEEFGTHIAFGMAEEDGALYNSLVLVGPEGDVVAVHRKVLTVHTNTGTSLDAPYTNGDGATIAQILGVPFGLIICNDMHSGTVAETLTDAGVSVVLSANADATPAPAPGSWTPIPAIYAAWLVQANRSGVEGETEYPGAISIADPAGTVRESMNGEGWVAALVGVYR